MIGFLLVFLVIATVSAGMFLWLSRWIERDGGERVPSDLGRAIGLVPDGARDVSGERDGIRLFARWTSVRRGGDRRLVHVMRYWAVLDPAIDVELGADDVLDGFMGARVWPDIENDARVRVGAKTEVDAALLRDPAIQRAIERAIAFGAFGARSTQIAAGHDGWDESSDALARGIDVVHALALALSRGPRVAKTHQDAAGPIT